MKETKEAIDSAQAAYKLWNATTAKERYDILMKLHGLCMANAEDLAAIITLEVGRLDSSSEEVGFPSGSTERETTSRRKRRNHLWLVLL